MAKYTWECKRVEKMEKNKKRKEEQRNVENSLCSA